MDTTQPGTFSTTRGPGSTTGGPISEESSADRGSASEEAGGGYHTDTVNELVTSSVTHFGQSISVRSEDPEVRQLYAVVVCTD
ncbi:hypothetical protein GCM10010260_29650 [Streptomyces filipinensis]|uniref:Uncharacterized protein n=1 Tax=Streptomyces filipinensis TaxID=66887 RepID=A0A918MAA2_9ACTN|nr:hypothetical protein GCM10010260_29650 [Streptomyces filipinensis]